MARNCEVFIVAVVVSPANTKLQKLAFAVRERLTSLGIMGDQLKALLKPLITIEYSVMYGDPQLGSHDAERRQSLKELKI